jgi:hypothetical protein
LKNEKKYGKDYDIFLRNIRDKEGKELELTELDFDYTNNTVTFQFANPDYLDDESLEYQYMLVGMSNEWSNWDVNNHTVVLNYLPAGKYELKVRTRNALAQESEVRSFTFSIAPPYWRQPWFYAMEVLFFSALLALSFRLNRSKMHNKVISKALTYLTLILTIDFISMIIESYITVEDNPVIIFAAQVTLSLLIFPFERLLANFITSKKTLQDNT